MKMKFLYYFSYSLCRGRIFACGIPDEGDRLLANAFVEKEKHARLVVLSLAQGADLLADFELLHEVCGGFFREGGFHRIA